MIPRSLYLSSIVAVELLMVVGWLCLLGGLSGRDAGKRCA